MPTHGIPGTSRAPDGGKPAVIELRPRVDEQLVRVLEHMLERARTGEARAIVAFLVLGGGEVDRYQHHGPEDFPRVLTELEDWKFSEIEWRRRERSGEAG